MTDSELLKRYQQDRSPEDLGEILRRHIDLVYAAALRETGNHHLAEDVAQAVFLVFVRRAPTLSASVVLSGWFFHATMYAAADARKLAARRRFHEREASQMESSMTSDPESASVSDEVRVHIQQAIARLSPIDRDAVVLRYLRGLSTQEVALALGTSELVARKRISRALERLRKQLARRGTLLVVGMLAVALTSLKNQAAPVALVERVESVALGKVSASALSRTLAARLEQSYWTPVLRVATIAAALAMAAVIVALAVGRQSAAAPAVPRAGGPVAQASAPADVPVVSISITQDFASASAALPAAASVANVPAAASPDPTAPNPAVVPAPVPNSAAGPPVAPNAAASPVGSAAGGANPVPPTGSGKYTLGEAPYDTAVFNPSGTLVLTGTKEKTLEALQGGPALAIWNVQTGRLVQLLEWAVPVETKNAPGETEQKLEWFQEGVNAVAFSPDGKQVASGAEGVMRKNNSVTGTIRIWDVLSGEEVRHWDGGAGPVGSVQFSSDGKRLLTLVQGESAKLWEVETGKLLAKFGGKDVTSTQFDPAGQRFVTVEPSSMAVWDAVTLKGKWKVDMAGATFNAAEFSPKEGGQIVAACSDMIRIWDAAGKLVREYRDGGYVMSHPVNYSRAHLNADEKSVAAVSTDPRPLEVWYDHPEYTVIRMDGRRFNPGFAVENLEWNGTPMGACFNLNGSRLASLVAPSVRTAQLLHPVTGWKVNLWIVKPLPGISDYCIRGVEVQDKLTSTPLAVFSSDGKRLLVHLNKTEIWDAEDGWTIEFKADRAGLAKAPAIEPKRPPGMTTPTGATQPAAATRPVVRTSSPNMPEMMVAPFNQQAAAARQGQWSEFLKTPSEITNSIGMKFALIPPGSFTMGTPATETQRSANEGPPRQVSLTTPFGMGLHHVTVADFRQFVQATGYKTQAESGDGAILWDGTTLKKDPKGNWQNAGFPQGDDHPVLCVSWNDARAFCKWLGEKEEVTYRLPTEAEWEYCCRAGTGSDYPWTGGEIGTDGHKWANCADMTFKDKLQSAEAFPWRDGFVYTNPAGSFRANAFGLYDMIGNAAQWCDDWYANRYPDADRIDPPGPKSGTDRVLRGSAWNSSPASSRTGFRYWAAPDYRSDLIGFRIVRELK